jgi:hypothetical protein
MKKMLVLQSGFVSPEHPGLIRPDLSENDTTFVSFILDKSYLSNPNVFFYERSINSLFAEYVKDFNKGTNWEFREECLKAIIRAIGAYSFMEWIEYQLDSPHVTELHTKFLKDTLEYIKKGKRNLTIESWYSLITVNSTTNKKRGNFEGISKNFSTRPSMEVAENFILIQSNTICQWRHNELEELPVSVRDLLAIWLGRKGGFHDLMLFAGTVFSRRDQIYSLG